MSEPTSRRRVTYTQLETLWELLNPRRDLALGFNKTCQARELSRRMWEEIASTLNSQGDGAEKDGKGWCKYWNDYKSKLKRFAVAQRQSHVQTGGGPASVKPLTEVEKKFLDLLGNNYGLGLSGARVEPFEEVPQEFDTVPAATATVEISESTITLPIMIHSQPPPVHTPPPHCSSPPHTAPPPVQSPPPPVHSPPPPVLSPPPPPSVTPLRVARGTTPRGTPRRRRQRREPPMSAEAARRLLVRESQRRADIDERNTSLLRELVDEIKEIKEMCRRQVSIYSSQGPSGEELPRNSTSRILQ